MKSTAPELQRITTEYLIEEDRLRLAGATPADVALAIWLTRRLLQRLLPELFKWLEQQGGKLPQTEALQSFATHSAKAQMKPQPPVKLDSSVQPWLATSVDMARSSQALRLVFKGAAGQQAGLTTSPKVLRQWLLIVQQQCIKAQWPFDFWPDWMTENAVGAPPSKVVLH